MDTSSHSNSLRRALLHKTRLTTNQRCATGCTEYLHLIHSSHLPSQVLSNIPCPLVQLSRNLSPLPQRSQFLRPLRQFKLLLLTRSFVITLIFISRTNSNLPRTSLPPHFKHNITIPYASHSPKPDRIEDLHSDQSELRRVFEFGRDRHRVIGGLRTARKIDQRRPGRRLEQGQGVVEPCAHSQKIDVQLTQ